MPALVAFLALVTLAGAAEERDTSLDWLTEFLAQHSTIDFPATADRAREIVQTRTKGMLEEGTFVIEYERVRVSSTGHLNQRQIILYPINADHIDPVTLAAQIGGESETGKPFWIVSFMAKPDPGFFPYDNIYEAYRADGSAETSRSKSKVRQVILGYIATKERAYELEEKFRAFLKTQVESNPAEAAPAASTRPTQSGA